ncbi:MAG TPA: hypothetical protein VMS17_11340 [Gemmataceae bacterium]|nr:hypothetical protein [Gemmataceae bacterium]
MIGNFFHQERLKLEFVIAGRQRVIDSGPDAVKRVAADQGELAVVCGIAQQVRQFPPKSFQFTF